MTTPKQPLESLAIHLDSERTTRVRHLNWIHRLRRCGRPKGVQGLGWWQELKNESIMEDCPCLVVSLRVFLLLFLCCCHFFPCCLFLFLLFLLLLMLLLLLFVAVLGASWCLVLVAMLVIIAISRHWHGRMVRRWNFLTFDSGSWKRRWAHHATRRDAFWSISGCQNAQNGILFLFLHQVDVGLDFIGIWFMQYTWHTCVYLVHFCIS